MSLFEKIKIRLTEVKKEPPIESGSVDPANQQGTFRKNERNKKKIMRKLEPKGPKQGELNLGNTKTTNTPISTKRTLKGRPLGSKTKPKGETYKQLTTGSERQRQRKTIKKDFKTQQPISDLKKAKKYAKGEYPQIKIKGGENVSGGLKPQIKKPVKGSTPVKTNVSKVNVDKIFSGVGNVKTGGKVPDKNISPKSKGSTPVKTNVSRVNVDKIFDGSKNPIKKTIGVKQSDVSKKAKEFTVKVNKRRAQRIKSATGGKKTGSLSKGNLSFPGDRSGAYQATKSDIQARKGFKDLRPGGLKADEKNPFVKRSVRKGRVDDLGGNIYDQPKFDQEKFEKGIQQTKKSKTFKKPSDPFKSSTPTGSALKGTEFKPKYSGTNPLSTEYAERQVAKGLKKYKKSFKKFSSDLKDFSDRDIPGGPKKPKIVGKKPPIDNTTRADVGMAPSDPLIKKGSASSGGGSSSSGGGSRKIKKKFKNINQSSGGSTSGSGSGGGRKPPKTSKLSTGGIDPDDVFKGKIPNKGGFSKKQFKKLRKDRKKQFKQFMKQMKKGSKQPVTPPAATPAKNLGKLGRVATRVIGKTNKGKLVRAGIVAGIGAAHFLDNAIRGPVVRTQKNKAERIGKPINPKTKKQYDSFVDIPRSVKNRTKEDRKTDNELRKYGVKSFSKDIVDKTAKGGRYNPTGTNINLKQYTQSDTYKNVLKQIQKKNKNPNLDPYGVMGNKK